MDSRQAPPLDGAPYSTRRHFWFVWRWDTKRGKLMGGYALGLRGAMRGAREAIRASNAARENLARSLQAALQLDEPYEKAPCAGDEQQAAADAPVKLPVA